MKRLRRVKIIATLGPASSHLEMVEKLFMAGADVFRLNMSHLPREKLGSQVAIIREVEQKTGRPVTILVDLQGPKLRIGAFANEQGIQLEQGQHFVLDSQNLPGDGSRVYLPHPDILACLKQGHNLLLDDGKIRLEIITANPDHALTKVLVGGTLKSKKGVSLPDTFLPVSAMTDKDRSDLEAALSIGVDWIALSFVQRPDDIAEVKKVVQGRAKIMAKIEKPQALQHLDAIIEMSDALMVARGDLGVEMPLEQVPGLQKRITRAARRLGKPVVVATQMLESMILAPVPTRAEVSDVATAVFEGADAIMLSAESAAGHYPIEAVETMNRIATEIERDALYKTILSAQRTEPEATGADAIAAAARDIAETLNLKTIVAWTSSGMTGLRIARERPGSPILALTPSLETARQLGLVWGVHAVVTEDVHDLNDMALRAVEFAKDEGFALKGERIIVVAGVPFGAPGTTNMLRLAFVDQ